MIEQPLARPKDRGDATRTAAVTALLALLGYAGNVLALPLLTGVDLIFCSTATMLAARVLGVLATLIVSLVASSHTLVVWHHPYAVIVFAAEALLVLLLYRGYYLDTLLVASSTNHPLDLAPFALPWGDFNSSAILCLAPH